MELIVYTDGAYSSLKNQGGIGVLMLENDKQILSYSNKYDRTTNNQMEIGAVIIALRLIKKEYDKITFYTDSQYVVGCATLGWQRKKNKKLWQEFDNQFERVSKLCNNISFIHIRGHQKDNSENSKYNNIVDKLAQEASQL